MIVDRIVYGDCICSNMTGSQFTTAHTQCFTWSGADVVQYRTLIDETSPTSKFTSERGRAMLTMITSEANACIGYRICV